MIENKAWKVRFSDDNSAHESDDSVQFVSAVLALDSQYWHSYEDGLTEARLASQIGCCPTSLYQPFNQNYGNGIPYL